MNVFLPFFETDDYTVDDNHVSQAISVEDYSDMTDFAISNFRNVSGIDKVTFKVNNKPFLMKKLTADVIFQRCS